MRLGFGVGGWLWDTYAGPNADCLRGMTTQKSGFRSGFLTQCGVFRFATERQQTENLGQAGLLGVGCDGAVDLESEGESFAGGRRSDAWQLAGLDGTEEVFKLQAQRFGARELALVEGEAG